MIDKEIIKCDLTEMFNNYSDYKLRKKSGETVKSWIKIIKDNEHIYVGRYSLINKFVGNKHFYKLNCNYSFTFKKNKFYGDIKQISYADLNSIFENLGIYWTKNLNFSQLCSFITDKRILSLILNEKITGEQTLFQKIASIIYHNKNMHWKTLRDFVFTCNNCSIYNLIDFTVDCNKSMKELIKLTKDENYSKLNLIHDVLHYATLLNQKIDFTWSERRLKDFHQKQINEGQKLECESKSETPIIKNVKILENPNVKLLNTEKEYYLESANMNNCVYSCYWYRFQHNKYLVFHISYNNEESSLGIDRCDPERIHQLYTKHNRAVTNETKLFVENWINENKSYIKSLFDCTN